MFEKYFLRACAAMPWKEVTKEMFIKAERNAGFYPKGYNYFLGEGNDICATGGFGSHSGVEGKIVTGG